MTEVNYSNRELDERFGNLLEHMQGFEKNTANSLDRIEAQTIKTNGSVAEAKKDIAKLQYWRAYITGALGILAFMITTIVAIAAIYSSHL